MSECKYSDKCNFCGSEKLRKIGRKGTGEKLHQQVEICTSCRLEFVNPAMSPEGLKVFYDQYGNDKLKAETEEEKHLWAKEILTEGRGLYENKIPELTKDVLEVSKKFLDIGSSNGLIVRIFQDNGWSAVGIEPSASFIDFRDSQRRISGRPASLPSERILWFGRWPHLWFYYKDTELLFRKNRI